MEEAGEIIQIRNLEHPISYPKCGGQISVVVFIQPPRREVIEKIL